MSNHLHFYEYEITSDTSFQNKRYGITPAQLKLIEYTAIECQNKNNKTIIPRLTQLIAEYPTIPMFYNFLSVAYNFRGNYEKSVEVNDLLFANHPDYLFGRINKVNHLIDEGRLEEIPALLGEALELKLLYPERNVFHISEITSYLNVVIRYCAATKNLEMAENRLKLLKDLDPDGPMAEQAESFLFRLRMESALTRLNEDAKQRISPVASNLVSKTDITDAPIFNHPEINNLYKFGLRIPYTLLKEILALPRQTLISDLELVLQDAINRYHYFLKLDYDEETQNFPVHAIFLLKELEAVSSLPKILEFLSFNYEFLEFWLGDHRTETVWQCLYGLGIHQTIVLKQFLIIPGIDTYSKSPVSVALSQIALHYPDRRKEISSLYAEVFNIFSESSVEDNLVDTDFLGLAIGDIINCGFSELLPIIKKLYDKNYVGTGISGTFIKVEKELNSQPRLNYIKEPLSIFKLYKHILNHWSGYNDKAESYKTPPPQKPAEPDKIGRNDPCPCGSGKKYKKCCME